jgi:N-acetylmuramoyl-L-alanine amidase
MGRPAALLAAALVLLVPSPGEAARARTASRATTRSSHAARPPTLPEAKAQMSALMRDPVRRRYHHQWEKAIRNLERSARGKDRAPALLEAARARYALYRWSANEADREKALALAGRAAKLGSKDAPALARAIRNEAGDDPNGATLTPRRGVRAPPSIDASASPPPVGRQSPPPPPLAPVQPHPSGPALAHAPHAAPASKPARPAPAAAAPAPKAEPATTEEDSPADPALEAALADLQPSASPSHPLGASGGEGPARVSEVRTWTSDDYTRVAIYLSHWTGWQKLELPAQPGHPRRLALDLRPAVLEGAALSRPVGGDQVDKVRAAQHGPDTVRVVLELPGGDGVSLFALDDPPRLVLDVGSRPAAVANATPPTPSPSPPTSSPTPTPSPNANANANANPAPSPDPDHAEEPALAIDEGSDASPGPIRRIVVDAGHGGHDPGAIGPRRVREKDVTLAMARRLAKKLQAAGFEVVLTRRDDRYLRLEDRTAIANTAHGNLFVSIHANAHPRRTRSGVETYFLNTAADRYAARLAARENGLDLDEGGGAEVTRIRTDLEAQSSAGASRKLAGMVQREVTGGVRGHIGEVRDLGVKSALFYVLLGARMPAVLVETGFISNRDEERRLDSGRYQEEVATGIARAVSAFARGGNDRVAAR